MKKSILSKIIISSLFVALISIGGLISFNLPMIKIPFSLQVLFILLAPLVLGLTYGSISVLIYILLGVIGFPIFANMKSGPVVLLGPTGGFLIGFIFSAPVVAILSKKIHVLLSLFIGLLIIYIFGCIQYSIVVNVSFIKSMYVCILPFVPFDLIKVALAYVVYLKLPKLY
jgi:biotin transport system substrate-specific component